MTPALTALLVGASCFAAHVLVTLLLLRVPGRMSPVARHAASAAVTHVAGVVAAGLALGPLPYWPIAAASGFGAVAWLFAFSAVYKSVSLRLLAQLASTTDGLSFETVTDEYVRPEFVARTEVLETMGLADGDDAAGFALTAAGQAAARRIAVVQRVCGIEKSGLYG